MTDFEIENFRLLTQGDRYLAAFDVALECGVVLNTLFLQGVAHDPSIAIVRSPGVKERHRGRAFRLPDDLRAAIGYRAGAAYHALTGKLIEVNLPACRGAPKAAIHRATGVLYTTDAGIAHYEPDDEAAGVRRVLGHVAPPVGNLG